MLPLAGSLARIFFFFIIALLSLLSPHHHHRHQHRQSRPEIIADRLFYCSHHCVAGGNSIFTRALYQRCDLRKKSSPSRL